MKVAVVSPGREEYSETFIRAHVDWLSSEVGTTIHLHGDVLPLWRDGRRAVPPWTLHAAGRLIERLLGKERGKATEFLAGQLPNGFRERAVAGYLVRTGVDVVLAEYGHTGLAMYPVTRRAGVPLVVHFHGYDAYHRDMLDEYGDEYRSLLTGADAVVAVSGDMVAQLERLGADPSRVHRVPYGIDLKQFRPPGVIDSGLHLVAVGRLVEKKAPHLTLLAFARAAEAHPQATLTMAGGGPLLDACKSMATALGLDDRVRFPGPVTHDRVRSLMRESRAFVQHSVRPPSGDSEGSPVAVREAMASGLPVVATRHAGIAETVVHEETGYLVDEHDWRSMAEYMSQLLEDPELAARFGRAGRRKAEEHFGIDASISRLANILIEVTDTF